jgi:hypothetical protein
MECVPVSIQMVMLMDHQMDMEFLETEEIVGE